MALTCGGRVGQFFLVGVNIIFLLMGLALMVPGILLQTNLDFVTNDIKPVLDDVTVGGVALGDVTKNLGIGFIIVGVFILLVSVFGLFGACCQNKCMLVTYAIIVAVLLIGQIIVIVLWFVMQSQLTSFVRTALTDTLRKRYDSEDLDSSNDVSNGWNYLFLTFDCCGVNAVPNGGAGDFESKDWVGKGPNQRIPKACCQTITEANYATYTNTACTDSVSAGAYKETGCYDAVINRVFSSQYSTIFLGIGIVIILIQVLAIVSSLLICKQQERGNLV